MADNLGYTPGVGATVATDDIGGVNYQRVKVVWGADGVANDASAAAPIPVAQQGTVDVSGSTVAVTGGVDVSGSAVSVTGTVPVSGPLTDTQLRAAAVPVSVPDLTVSTTDPQPDTPAVVVAPRPQDTWVVSFAGVGSSLVTPDMTQRRLGTGVGVSQSSGNLVVTSGTTTNAEFLARSTKSFRGAWIARAQVQLSQRIVNQNFAVLLADRIGEGLSYTINSATSVTVTLTGHTFTAENVGQFMFLGAISGAAGVPGRYAIASVVAGTSITFTVAGWPASGSGTLDLFGWNWVRTLYSGTTATNALADAQRRGWNSGDTTLTIQSTAASGHIVQMAVDGRNTYWSDTLAASAAAPALVTRGSRFANMPDQDVELFLYLWLFNGTVAPASTTTWTVGFVSVEDTVNLPVYLAGNRAQSMPMPVVFPAAQPVSGTVTANIGTGALAAGTNAIGDVGRQYRANATGAATLANLACPATPAAQNVKGTAGRLLSITATNTNAAARWIKLWNTLNTGVTMGTTAAIAELAIPPNQTVTFVMEGGLAFSTAISIAVTGGQGLTNNTAVTLGDVTGLIGFA
jgi:hypothetical protein